MREIEFRGRAEKGERWVYGDLVRYAGRVQIWEHQPDGDTWNYIVDPDTVGQYVGITDRNQKPIFEGDIVKTKHYGKDNGHGRNFADYDIFKVEFLEGAFYLTNEYRKFLLHSESKCEVIGNVYDNIDLLQSN